MVPQCGRIYHRPLAEEDPVTLTADLREEDLLAGSVGDKLEIVVGHRHRAGHDRRALHALKHKAVHLIIAALDRRGEAPPANVEGKDRGDRGAMQQVVGDRAEVLRHDVVDAQ